MLRAGSSGAILSMASKLDTPEVPELDHVVHALRRWLRDDAPIQLHPGDLGWHWRFGAELLAGAVRIWTPDGEILAAGFLDGLSVLRLTVAPEMWRNDKLAREVVAHVSCPERGVLPAGKASVEAPNGTRIQELLSEGAWSLGAPWTPLRFELAEPNVQSGLRMEVVDSDEKWLNAQRPISQRGDLRHSPTNYGARWRQARPSPTLDACSPVTIMVSRWPRRRCGRPTRVGRA